MMKQPNTVAAPPIPGLDAAKEQTVLEFDEEDKDPRIEILCEQTKTALILKGEKSKLLKRMFNLRSSILEKAEMLDMVMQVNLHQYLEKVIPSKKKDYQSSANTNEDLAGSICSLFEPMEMLHTHLLEQEAERNARRSAVRASTASTRKVDKVLEVCGVFVNLKEKAERRLLAVQNERNNPFIRGFLPVTPAQRDRLFSKKLVPKDTALQKCLMCGHLSINEQVENEAIVAHNKEVTEIFEKRKEVYEKFKSDIEKTGGKRNSKKVAYKYPTDPADSTKQLTSKPVMGATKSQRL